MCFNLVLSIVFSEFHFFAVNSVFVHDMSTVIEQLQFFGKQSWLPRMVSLLIVLFFLWWAISRITPLFENDQQTITAEKESSEQLDVIDDKASLDQLNLFGRSKQEIAEEKTSPEKLTNLRFILKGIFSTNDPKQGAVQIQNDRQQESNFTVGESVFGQATLDEIYPDRVILYRNGKYETLMMPGKSLTAKYFSVAKQQKKPAINKPEIIKTAISKQLQNKKPVTTQALYTPQSANQTATKKQNKTNEFQTISISGNGEILRDLFVFNTAWNKGNFIGFVIEARGEKGLKLMDVLGVKNHDLITVINGLRFSEKLDSPEQLEKLKTATSIDAIFERDGKEIPFHFDFDKPLSNL